MNFSAKFGKSGFLHSQIVLQIVYNPKEILSMDAKCFILNNVEKNKSHTFSRF